MTIAAIPSPSTAVWHVAGFPIRAYALCIVLGIVVACVVTEARLRRRGAAPWAVLDIAVWAVPFGIVGARIYHLITSPQAYFGKGGDPVSALYIWEGGLGIWGAVAGGAVGAWLAARQLGIPLTVIADAVAPGLPLAQAVGRFGNWFNNELYGGPTTLPWGLRVYDMDPANPGRARELDGEPVLLPGLYHPTFLYEALWNVGVALLVFAADRRWKFGHGRAFALYVMGYTAGRFWIEIMRIDEANRILGTRVNVWVSVLVFLGALIYFLRVRGPQQFLVPLGMPGAPAVPAAASEPAAEVSEPVGRTGGATATAGDISQRDVTQTGASQRPAVPIGYVVVTEDDYREYERTGVLPPAADEAGDAGTDPTRDDQTDGDPTDGGPTGGAPGDGPGGAHAAPGGDPPQARATARSSDDR